MPELRFNGDFSHWYTGLEMPYGDFEEKLEFLRPVFERTRFLHGRIGDPGCIQVDVGDDPAHEPTSVAHFRSMWTAAMRGFLASATDGDVLPFVPELLPAGIHYARTIPDDDAPPDADGRRPEREEGDRWTQALRLVRDRPRMLRRGDLRRCTRCRRRQRDERCDRRRTTADDGAADDGAADDGATSRSGGER